MLVLLSYSILLAQVCGSLMFADQQDDAELVAVSMAHLRNKCVGNIISQHSV